MARTASSKFVGPDADSATARLQSDHGDRLRVVAEYDGDDYRFLHVAEHVVEEYGDLEDIRGQGDDVHEYVTLDFLERELQGDIFPGAGDLHALTAHYENVVIVRWLVDETALFVSAHADVPVSAILDILDDEL